MILFKFYVLIDPIDNKIKYVGRTVDAASRLRNHVYEARKNNHNKRERWIIYLLRRNKKPILKVIYSKECSVEEAISIEKMLIKKLSRRYDLKNEPDHACGATFRGKPVFQYDLDGNFLASYRSTTHAELVTGVHNSAILQCCKKKSKSSKSAGGFLWSWVLYKKYPIKYVKETSGKPVIQYDTTGKFIKRYPTARAAEKTTGVGFRKISASCTTRQKTAGGFTWKFE